MNEHRFEDVDQDAEVGRPVLPADTLSADKPEPALGSDMDRVLSDVDPVDHTNESTTRDASNVVEGLALDGVGTDDVEPGIVPYDEIEPDNPHIDDTVLYDTGFAAEDDAGAAAVLLGEDREEADEAVRRPVRGKRRFRRSRWLAAGLTFLAIEGAVVVAVGPVSVVSETCATNEQPTYFVRTCFLSPTQQLTIDGDTPVEVSVEPEGEFPGIRRMVFYINDEYVLTDYEAPYHFVLPAASFPSGPATLAVEAVLRDDTIAPQVSIELTIDRVEVAFDVPAPGFRPALGTSPPSGTPFVIAAVGDGASGRRAADQVVDVIRNMAPNMVLYLGDVYERGSYTEFRNWYGTSGESWDQFSGITNPVVGNHERLTEASAGYFEYWNDPPLYYSLDVNGWTVIALDLQATRPSEEQLAWLQDQLVSSNECTLVMQHHPVFSVGPHGDHQDADELWPLFAEAGVDLLLAGHEHNYQRWLPLGSDMQPDEEGPLQIIVGTGGHGIRPTNGSDERAATVFDAAPAAFGALRLELNQTGAVATYLDIGGETLDWTARSCSDAAVDVTPPSQPREPSGFAPDGNRVELEWARSQDDTAVGAYLIERDGIVVGEASGGNRSFTDMTVDANTLYEYQVSAVDLAGNRSAPTPEIFVATGDPASVLVFAALADSYVNPDEPGVNYGTAPRLRVDGDPPVTTFMTFEVPELAGPVVQATLRVRAESPLGVGYAVAQVDASRWTEEDITFNNAPEAGAEIAVAPPKPADTWVEIDVTAGISGPGTYSFALRGLSSTNHRMSSREGSHAPELIIEIDVTGS